uniref:Transcriptional antiterminator n=1 Tax=Eubacterium cellulosolvens (strain ATCC 43171 / JCM 9499 / 6) TaxID=633697 RepID=I5AXA3_EUBC6
MIVVKNINNNVSLCLDSQNNEVVVFGKGVGFCKPPYDIPLDRIEKTFYNVSDDMVERLNTIRPEILDVSSGIIDLANQKLGNQFGANAIFTLADHIQFAETRQKENIVLSLPILSEVSQNYPDEYFIGKKALELIKEKLGIAFSKEEASAIALHLVNYESSHTGDSNRENGQLINETVEIIERELSIQINKESFNYHRFVTHMFYLFKRVRTDCMIDTDNHQMYDSIRTQFPQISHCADLIRELIGKAYDRTLSDEEVMYMILHINRMCDREDCDR